MMSFGQEFLFTRVTGSLAIVFAGLLCASASLRAGAQVAAANPFVVITLQDGGQLTGIIASQTPTTAVIQTSSLDSSGAVLSSVTLHKDGFKSCTMRDPNTAAVPLFGTACTAVKATFFNGFQAASLSGGIVGSAQRDASVKASFTLAAYQGLDSHGSFRAKTGFVGTASYDDKWKSTPLQGNVTQFYEGILTQDLFFKRTPLAKCGSDAQPLSVHVSGYAYHNNSQGIRVDQSDGVGVQKTWVSAAKGGTPSTGCAKSAPLHPFTVELEGDIRSVNYILYQAPEASHGVGIGIRIGASKMFAKSQVIAFSISGTPVLNNVSMSNASGYATYVIPIDPQWSLQFTVSDNYYQVAPTTFNKNYVSATFGVKYTAPTTKTPQ